MILVDDASPDASGEVIADWPPGTGASEACYLSPIADSSPPSWRACRRRGATGSRSRRRPAGSARGDPRAARPQPCRLRRGLRRPPGQVRGARRGGHLAGLQAGDERSDRPTSRLRHVHGARPGRGGTVLELAEWGPSLRRNDGGAVRSVPVLPARRAVSPAGRRELLLRPRSRPSALRGLRWALWRGTVALTLLAGGWPTTTASAATTRAKSRT